VTDPAVVALVRTIADLLTRWADAHTRPPEPPPDAPARFRHTP
jgi:hypothetical protein